MLFGGNIFCKDEFFYIFSVTDWNFSSPMTCCRSFRSILLKLQTTGLCEEFLLEPIQIKNNFPIYCQVSVCNTFYNLHYACISGVLMVKLFIWLKVGVV